MAQINFVRQRRKQLEKLGEADKRYFTITSYVVGGILVVFAAFFGYRIYLNAQLKNIETMQNNYKQQVLAQEDREEAFVIFVNKIETLSQIFQGRKNKQEAIDYFSSVFDNNVLVERIVYQADDETLSFGIRANSVFAIEQVFDVLESEQTRSTFPTLEKSSLQRGRDGSYGVQVTVLLGGEEQVK